MKNVQVKIIKLVALLSVSPMVIVGQTQSGETPVQTGVSFWTKFPHYLEDPLIWLGIFMLLITGTTIYALYQSVATLTGRYKTEHIEIKAPVVRVKKISVYSKIMKSLTRSVPVAQEKDVLLDHNYDGIMELDNQLPPWWKWGFYFTIAFSVVYLLSYHVAGTGKLSHAEYEAEMLNAKLEKENRMKNSSGYVTAENVVALTDNAAIADGKSIYIKLCATCHGNEGGGNVGPNLTDQYWINGGGIHNIFHTITEGVPAKGMISWKSQLSPKDIQCVASFILTMQGTTPPGAKEPQGEKWVDESSKNSESKPSVDSTSLSMESKN